MRRIVHFADEILRDDRREADHFAVDGGDGPSHLGDVRGDPAVDILRVHLDDLGATLLPPHFRRCHLLTVVGGEGVRDVGKRVGILLVVVGVVGRFLVALWILLAGLLRAQMSSASAAQVWVASWSASQQVLEPQNGLPADDLHDATVRQIFHLSLGGAVLRVHVSNAFGTEGLHFTSVHVAKPLSTSSAAIDPTSDRALKFAGNPDVTVPPGAEFLSDPLDYPVAGLSDLAVTFHLDATSGRETGHPGSRATSYYVRSDWVGAPNLSEPKHVDHWYQMCASSEGWHEPVGESPTGVRVQAP